MLVGGNIIKKYRTISNCTTMLAFKNKKYKSEYYSFPSYCCYSLKAVDSLSWIDIMTFIVFKNLKLGCYASMLV